jgi:hypothetical protein
VHAEVCTFLIIFVSILMVRVRFCNRSQKFMDAYAGGLNGRQAAWAARKYKGHRVPPEGIMNEIEKANVV